MAKIFLSNGGETLVDDADFEWLNQWKWTRDADGYALRFFGPRDNQRQIRMHRAIINAPKDKQVDHINRERLDNRRSNLRLCSNSENQMNKNVRKDSKTGFKGVTLHKKTGLFMARLVKDKKTVHCTYHKTPEEAAQKYIEIAKKYHGRFASW